MQWTHLHLALNHLPVVGLPIFTILLLAGLFRKSEDLKKASLIGILMVCAAVIPVKLSGDYSVEEAGKAVWFTQDPASPSLVKKHEDLGDQTSAAVFVLGLLTLGSLVLGRRMKSSITWLNGVVFVLSVATCIMLLFTANSGGDLRHTEIRNVPETIRP